MARYSISKTSRFLNVSNELLRHYERLGLIEPEHGENGYRYFSYREITKLQGIRRFRNMGYSLAETEKLMTTASFDDVEEMLDTALERNRMQLFWQQELDNCLRHIAKEWGRIRKELWQCRVSESPAILMTGVLQGHEIKDDELPDGLTEWLERMPVVFIAPTFSRDGILGSNLPVSFSYGVLAEVAERIGLRHVEEAVNIPRSKCVSTIICSRGSGYISCASLNHVVRFCVENGLRICGDAWGMTLGNCMEDGEVVRYHRVYVPVE